MHVFDRKNWISIFCLPLFSGIALLDAPFTTVFFFTKIETNRRIPEQAFMKTTEKAPIKIFNQTETVPTGKKKFRKHCSCCPLDSQNSVDIVCKTPRAITMKALARYAVIWWTTKDIHAQTCGHICEGWRTPLQYVLPAIRRSVPMADRDWHFLHNTNAKYRIFHTRPNSIANSRQATICLWENSCLHSARTKNHPARARILVCEGFWQVCIGYAQTELKGTWKLDIGLAYPSWRHEIWYETTFSTLGCKQWHLRNSNWLLHLNKTLLHLKFCKPARFEQYGIMQCTWKKANSNLAETTV